MDPADSDGDFDSENGPNVGQDRVHLPHTPTSTPPPSPSSSSIQLKGEPWFVEAGLFGEDSETYRCSKHPNRDITFICSIDQELLCPSCLPLHSDHPISRLEGAALTDRFKGILTRSSQCLRGLEQGQRSVKEELLRVLKQRKASRELVEASRRSLLRQINSIMDSMLDSIKEISASKEAMLRKQHASLTASVVDLAQFEQNVQQLIQGQDYSHALHLALVTEPTLESLVGIQLDPVVIDDMRFITHEQRAVQDAAERCLFGQVLSQGVDPRQSKLVSDNHVVVGQSKRFEVEWRTQSGELARLVEAKHVAVSVEQTGAPVKCITRIVQNSRGSSSSLGTTSPFVEFQMIEQPPIQSSIILHVRFNGLHIQGSPVRLTLASPQQCKLSGPLIDISHSGSLLRTRAKEQFSVTVCAENGTTVAGGGDLVEAYSQTIYNVSNLFDVSGPNKTILSVHDNEDGTYSVEFTSNSQGHIKRVFVFVNKVAVPGSPFDVQLSGLVIQGQSTLFPDDENIPNLERMLPANRRTLTKLMDSSRGRCGAKDFHFAAHGKGQILVVALHLRSRQLFGGYVEDVFTGEDEWIEGSPLNFVFCLTSNPPIKLTRRADFNNGVHMKISSAGLWMNSDLSLFGDDPECAGFCRQVCYTVDSPDFPLERPLLPGQLAGLHSDRYEWSAYDVLIEVFQCS